MAMEGVQVAACLAASMIGLAGAIKIQDMADCGVMSRKAAEFIGQAIISGILIVGVVVGMMTAA